MSDPLYTSLCWVIRFSPALFMSCAWLYASYRHQKQAAIPMTLIIGYLTGVISIWAYWEFAGRFAPTEEKMLEVFQKDGNPRIFAPFVAPLYLPLYGLVSFPLVRFVLFIKPVVPLPSFYSSAEENDSVRD